MEPSQRGPFSFQFQSKSPALGCLMVLVGLVVALVVGFFTVLALIWKLLRNLILPLATAPQQAAQPNTEVVDYIDVESTVITAELPDESIHREGPQA